MATIVTRSGKGSPLTNTEVDANFTNLNTDKIETDAQVRASVEAASDSNVFTDADHTKLNNVEAAATADQTAAEILTAVKTVDGATSGLDADLLDGQHGSYYTGYTDTAVSNLVDSSPAALNTLNELAAALGDDASFSSTVNTNIAAKLPLAGGAMTGAITTNSTFDGRDVATDGTKLDGIEASADVTDTANVVNALTAGSNITISAGGTIAGSASYTHPNHSGEVISTGDGATVVADNIVDEANLKVSNTPTNGYFLSAQSGASGGLTWATVPAGYTDADAIAAFTAGTNIAIAANGTISSTDTNTVYTDADAIAAFTAGTNIAIAANGTISSTDQTAAQLLTAIKTVDGAGSGLDADLLDGNHASAFLQSYTETDTLATVTSRGATTTSTVSVNTNNTAANGFSVGETFTNQGGWHGQMILHGTGHARSTVKTGNVLMGTYAHDAWHNISGSTQNGHLGTYTNHGVGFIVNASLKMALNTSGNLGINVSAPTEKLDVGGNIKVSGTVDGRDVAADGTKLDTIATSANNYSFPYTVSTSAGNSTVVQRHASGYIFANYFNTTPNTVTSGITQVCVETGNDGYIRHGTAAAVRSFLNVADGATAGSSVTNNNQLTNGAGYTTYTSNQATNTNSSVTFNTVTAASFNATSDINLKTNIKSIEDPLGKITELNGYSFNWKDTGKPSLGVMAQEVEKVLPSAVTEDEDGIKSVNYNEIIGVLVEAVKKQQVQIDTLKEKLNG